MPMKPQNQLHQQCWMCLNPATKRLWYEDNRRAISKDLCDKHFGFYHRQLKLSAATEEEVVGLILECLLTHDQ